MKFGADAVGVSPPSPKSPASAPGDPAANGTGVQ